MVICVFSGDDFHSMQCMSHLPNNRILVGGHQHAVFEFDLNRLQLTNKVMSELLLHCSLLMSRKIEV